MIPIESKVIVDGNRKGVVVGIREHAYLVLFEDSAGWVDASRVEPNGQLEMEAT